MTVDSSVYSAHFYDLLTSNDRYIIAFGSRGSGKTHHIIMKLLLLSFKNEYNHVLYVNKEFRHIQKQQFSEFKKVAKQLDIDKYFTFYNGDYRIINNITGVQFTPIGMDDAEKTKGITDPTVIWWDEISKGELSDFLTLNALLRTPLNKNLQFIISFNPISEKHWLRTFFFDEKDAYKINERFKDLTYLNHSTYKDNEFIDKETYLQTLILNAHGNTNRMLVDIEGRWGVEEIVNPFFYAFNFDNHYKDTKYSFVEQSQIILSFDFNASPTTLLIGQMHNKKMSIIDLFLTDENSIKGLSPIESACEMFRVKYLLSGLVTTPYIIVTGDASGRSKSADNVANKNFYSKIKQKLYLSDSQVKVRKSNTTHLLSREICNAFMYNCDFTVYKSASLLIDDFNMAYTDINGTLNDAKKKNGLHIVDAFRYMIDCVLQFDKWQDYVRYYSKNN